MAEEKKKVFIVEDDEFLRSLNAKKLEESGYAVAVAVDGSSAIDLIPKEKPDLIFLDLLLPGEKDGFDVLREVKGNAEVKDTPVIVFSNLGQAEDIEKAKGLGAADFLVKANFTLDDVVLKIKEFLK